MDGSTDEAARRRLFEAMSRAVAERAHTIEELALKVGCTPHEALSVLLKFDRDGGVTVTVASRSAVAEDIVVRLNQPTEVNLAPEW